MKKRFLSLLVCLFVLLPACLTGCAGDGETIEVTQNKASAITLTMYSIVEDGTTQEAIKAVQDALNEITENTLNTHVELKFFTESEYTTQLNEKLDAIQADMDLQARLTKAADVARKAARSAGYSIKNATTEAETAADGEAQPAETQAPDETKINEYGIADTIYPAEIDGQLDLFLINSFDMYNSLIDKGVLSALEGEISMNSKVLKNYIYPTLLNSANYKEHTYAIPNNHVVGECTYMLVNKDVATKYGYTEATFTTAASLLDTGFLAAVSAGEGADTVLMLNDPKCTIDYATGEAEGLLGTYVTVPMSTSQKTYPPELVYEIPTYKSVLTIKNQYKNSIMYGDMTDYSDKTVATAFITGTYADVQQYGEDYYLVAVDAPTYSMDDVCQGMYAISTYSVSVPRSMEIIELLTTEPDVVNLLAYGVENVNYIKRDSSEYIELINNDEGNPNYYRMNTDYAGNQYKRYVTEDASADDKLIAADNWAAAKQQNLMLVSLPYANFGINTEMVPEYIAPEDTEIDDEDEEDTDDTADETTAEAGEQAPVKTYMPVADMLAGLEALYADCKAKIESFDGTDPDTGEAMTFSEFIDALAERLHENEYVSQALDECNSASVISQYTAIYGG